MKCLISSLLLLILLQYSGTASAQTPTPVPTSQDTAVITIPNNAAVSPQAMGQWLKKNTPNDYEAVKALYHWIGHHITYDVVMMTSRTDVYKDTLEAAVRTLTSRKAICQGYCSLFYEVCKQASIPLHLVSGYVYINGQLALDGGHSWLGIKLNNKWHIIDPTWGTGSVDDNNKFAFGFNWDNFLISPDKAIFTHVPFDPVYQYLTHPVKPAELRDQTWSEASKRSAINFEDSLLVFSKQNMLQSYTGRLQRLEKYGIINQLQREQAQYLRQSMPYAAYASDSISGITGKYRALVDRSNKLVSNLNAYSAYVNGGMKPAKSDKEILDWLTNLNKEAKDIHAAVSPMNFMSAEMQTNKNDFVNRMKSMISSLENSQKSMSDFLTKRKLVQR
ncbi:transglutaminase superfamily protein [Chitinophaga dinghuensis]|uniref:Transglutaminase superfamily protein n=1 Tax=Chitinophaga dinghuensis TaxID=1539050 RepID=A0A327WDX9_9BACT|nr:transglutaminase domain-containing protein [Chitinophaga dinghuensis]RAJ87570.1 transglutaminase superfamily protein [Chitinophaga dinghuensis]